MKRAISVIAAMLMLLMMLSLAACSSATVQPTVAPLPAPTVAPAPTDPPTDPPTEAPTEDPLDGTYELDSMSVEGSEFDSATLKSVGVSGTLTISGKTAVMKLTKTDGETSTSSTSVDRENSQFVDPDGTKIPYTVSGDSLTLTADETSMTFKKQ